MPSPPPATPHPDSESSSCPKPSGRLVTVEAGVAWTVAELELALLQDPLDPLLLADVAILEWDGSAVVVVHDDNKSELSHVWIITAGCCLKHHASTTHPWRGYWRCWHYTTVRYSNSHPKTLGSAATLHRFRHIFHRGHFDTLHTTRFSSPTKRAVRMRDMHEVGHNEIV
jgi:hypothetical protein